MALDFSSLPPEQKVPDKPPSRLVWTVVFFLLTLLGVFAVLMLWPADEPTHTPWFWTCVAVFPAAIAAFVVSRVYSAYEGRRLDAQAWNGGRKRYVEQAYALESVPFFVLDAALRVTENNEENAVEKIVDGTLTLNAESSKHEDNESIAARWLEPADARLAADDSERHALILEWLYDRLLDDLATSLTALPSELPLHVLLDISGYVGETDALTLWRGRWNVRALRIATSGRLPATTSLMSLDTWLDDRNGPWSKRATLLISVSLTEVLAGDPPDGSAEAGVGLLMVPPALAAGYGLCPLASIHRPLRSEHDDLNHALSFALRWASAEPKSVGGLWITGFDGEAVGSLHASLNSVGVTAQRAEALTELDLDRKVGRAGPASGWLAAACAVRSASASTAPQLLAQREEDHTLLAVVVAANNESQKTSHTA